MTTTNTRRTAPAVEERILRELAAGASVQQLCASPHWRIDDVAAVFKARGLTVNETTGYIVPGPAGGDPLLVLLSFSSSPFVRRRARAAIRVRERLAQDLANAQALAEKKAGIDAARSATNSYIDWLRKQLTDATAHARTLATPDGNK